MNNRFLLLFLVLLPSLSLWAQQGDPYDQRGVQFAAQGTDFWVCFPRTMRGYSPNMSRLYVVSERDCDVTVTNELAGYSQTFHIMRRELCGADTNYIEIPNSVCRICDTLSFVTEYLVHDSSYAGCICDLPQPRGFHVTSTDTISLFIFMRSMGVSGACNVLPTEMMRDEYIVQSPPSFRELLFDNSVAISAGCATVDIVAVDDSTVVDIILSDWDWVNRHPGDTITVTLRRGELFHVAAGEVREKYYPLFEPYYIWYITNEVSPQTRPVWLPRHAFDGSLIPMDTFVVDLTGTRIKARDCKRIAVFEGGSTVYIPQLAGTCDMLLEQAHPVKYAGTEFLLPNVAVSDTDYIRITALHDNTLVTIRDGSRMGNSTRNLVINANQTDWFAMLPDDGPFYITTSHPAMVKEYIMRSGQLSQLDVMWGDPAFFAVTPVEWWHNGQINFGTITDVDSEHNRQSRYPSLYIFARTDDVSSIWMDGYNIGSHFTPLRDTPYSLATMEYPNRFVSQGTHYIKSTAGAKFMAVMSTAAPAEQAVFNLPHRQPGHRYLKVNGIPADSLKEDSIWCMYDPITFKAGNQRPADSIFWDFGDGTTLAYSHLDAGFDSEHIHTYTDTGKYRVMCIYTYEYDSCFTLKPDTLWAPIWIHNHYDSAFSVRICDGFFTFRAHLLDYSDTHYITTYWTPSGCDTLWQIDLITCPHCSWDYDTISPEQLPYLYNGYTFNGETHNEPISLDIGDTCDSVIFYTLIVIAHWGEPPIDSVFILAPNIVTPQLESNNRFALYCSRHILQAEVSIFNRMGTRVAQFDGLTGSWDGTSDGRTCTQGTYVYFVRYIDSKDNSWKTVKGTVTLIY